MKLCLGNSVTSSSFINLDVRLICMISFTLRPHYNLYPLIVCVCLCVGRDRAVGIATPYGLCGPGFKSRWVRDCPHLSRPALGTTQPPIQRVSGLFPRGRAPGTWRLPPTTSSPEVKGRVELYICSPSAPSWPVLM